MKDENEGLIEFIRKSGNEATYNPDEVTIHQPQFTKSQLRLIKAMAISLRLEMEQSIIDVNSPFYGYTKTDLADAIRIINKL